MKIISPHLSSSPSIPIVALGLLFSLRMQLLPFLFPVAVSPVIASPVIPAAPVAVVSFVHCLYHVMKSFSASHISNGRLHCCNAMECSDGHSIRRWRSLDTVF